MTKIQRNILRGMLYDNMVIMAYAGNYIVKSDIIYNEDEWKRVPTRTFNCLKEKNFLTSRRVAHKGIYHFQYKLSYRGIEAASDTRLIEKAKKVVRERAAKFTPQENPHILIFVDEAGEYIEVVELGSKDDAVCEQCVAEAGIVKKYTEKLKSGGITCNGAMEVESEWAGDINAEDFVICQECGKIIDVCTTFTNQELDHWLKDRKPGEYSEQECWEILQILEYHMEDPELTPRIEELARKVLEVNR